MVAINDRTPPTTTARHDRATRTVRVRRLRRQIQAGRYVVDVDRLAEVLVERARFHRRVKADLLCRRAPTEL